MDEAELKRRFTYHPPPGPEAIVKYETIRDVAKDFARLICTVVPECREQSLAITALEQAVMWANAGIARRGDKE